MKYFSNAVVYFPQNRYYEWAFIRAEDSIPRHSWICVEIKGFESDSDTL